MKQSFSNLIEVIFNHPWNEESQRLLKQVQGEYPSICRIFRQTGEYVYQMGNPATHVYLLVSGNCNVVCISLDGNYSTLYINEAPTQYGLMETLSERDLYSATILATSDDCSLIKIPAPLFKELLRQNPSAMMRILCSEEKIMAHNLDNNLRRVVLSHRQRLILYLYESSIIHPLPYSIKMDRTTLAATLGINLRTLYRYTDALAEKKALSIQKGKLCITKTNMHTLTQLAREIYMII